MSEIRIPIPVAIAVLIAAIAAAVGAQIPEIKRYLNVKGM